MGLLRIAAVAAVLAGSCDGKRASAPAGDDPWAARRETMVREQLAARDVRSEAVLAAMRKVPRHEFVPAAHRDRAYADHALPIEEEQTISQPYIVALMTELAALDRGSRVLEVGTGSGYQAAVLAELAGEVYSIEIVASLGRAAAARRRRSTRSSWPPRRRTSPSRSSSSSRPAGAWSSRSAATTARISWSSRAPPTGATSGGR